jgi:hypothetical protein
MTDQERLYIQRDTLDMIMDVRALARPDQEQEYLRLCEEILEHPTPAPQWWESGGG